MNQQHKQPVDEVDSATDAAVALGATPTKHQPAPEQWHVLLDPVGHPFCLNAVRPD
ncbi:VOC family protein [Arthrobacter sp. OAP107]|uniref:VOC family protein n=1 Tax=Arthrobacter sp. OAP107 TaxID=3156445 RepID=UPI0033922A9A